MKMNNLRAVFLVMVLLGLPSIAWVEGRQEIIGKISEIKDTIYEDYRNFYSIGDLEDLGSAILGELTLGLYVQDENIQDWVQENRNDTSNDVAKFAESFGNGIYILPPLAGFYLYGHFSENEKVRRIALLSLESYAVSGFFCLTIKFATHRHRPSEADSPDIWDGPSLSTSHLSFPSGHTQSAFSIATVIASEYSAIAAIPPLAYGLATLTALSRVYNNAHWASDVLFGSAISYFTAKAVIRRHEKDGGNNFIVLPLVDRESIGLLLSYQF